MKLTRFTLIAAMACGAFLTQHAQAANWQQVEESSSGDRFDMDVESAGYATNKGGEDMAHVVGRMTLANGDTSFYVWYVKLAECPRGYGNLVILDLDGAFLARKPFVFDGGNVAASIATRLCKAHLRGQTNKSTKPTNTY